MLVTPSSTESIGAAPTSAKLQDLPARWPSAGGAEIVRGPARKSARIRDNPAATIAECLPHRLATRPPAKPPAPSRLEIASTRSTSISPTTPNAVARPRLRDFTGDHERLLRAPTSARANVARSMSRRSGRFPLHGRHVVGVERFLKPSSVVKTLRRLEVTSIGARQVPRAPGGVWPAGNSPGYSAALLSSRRTLIVSGRPLRSTSRTSSSCSASPGWPCC